MLAKPIPDGVQNTDPVWQSQFIELANALVIAGAKGKIIERYTGLTHRRVREIYQALRNEHPPSGPVFQGTPQFFATNRENSFSWNLQCAIFMECYSRLEKLIPIEVNRGWLLLKAFHAYQQKTQKLYQAKGIRRLDINNAYSLLVMTGFGLGRSNADLHSTTCTKCHSPYLVIANEEPEGQPCPVCAINANLSRLNEQARAMKKNDGPAGNLALAV